MDIKFEAVALRHIGLNVNIIIIPLIIITYQ